MKAASPLASRVLLVAGLVLILSALIDYFVLVIPWDFAERARQIALASQFVDRGVVPLVGVTFLLLGGWIQTALEDGRSRPFASGARIGAVIVALLLSLLFLLLVPLHFNNVRIQKAESIAQIKRQADQAKDNLEPAIQAQLTQERTRIQTLLGNEQLLNQAIASGQLEGEQVALLQQFKDQPNSVEPYLAAEAEREKTRLNTEITTREATATQEAETLAWKASARTVLSSLLLAIAYGVLVWVGLQRAS